MILFLLPQSRKPSSHLHVALFFPFSQTSHCTLSFWWRHLPLHTSVNTLYSYMASCYSFTDEIAIAISCLSRQYLLLSSFTLQEGCSLPNSSGAAHHSAIKYSGHLHYSAWAALPAAIGKGEQGQYHSCLNSRHGVHYSFQNDPSYHLVVPALTVSTNVTLYLGTSIRKMNTSPGRVKRKLAFDPYPVTVVSTSNGSYQKYLYQQHGTAKMKVILEQIKCIEIFFVLESSLLSISCFPGIPTSDQRFVTIRSMIHMAAYFFLTRLFFLQVIVMFPNWSPKIVSYFLKNSLEKIGNIDIVVWRGWAELVGPQKEQHGHLLYWRSLGFLHQCDK